MDTAMSLSVLGSYSSLIIPFGLFLGLLGYRLYKISLFVIGIFFGLALGSWIGDSVDSSRLGLILGIILGLTFGVAGQFLIRFSLFIAGMAGGAALASIILPETAVVADSIESYLWMGGAGLAGGLLTIALYKILILIATSLLGTYMIYVGTVDLLPPETLKWLPALYIILFIVFVLVQIGHRRGRRDPIEIERIRRRRQPLY